MIWNEQVKEWLIKNMNEYRNTNGRLSINKMQEGIESEFNQPMDEGEFIKWTDNNKVKQCDGIKRLKHRLAKRTVKHNPMLNKLSNRKVVKEMINSPSRIFPLEATTISIPTISNLETLNYNGKLWISLQDHLKLLNIHSS